MTVDYVPAGLDKKNRLVQQAEADKPAGVNVTFEDSAQKKGVSFLSGVFGAVTEGSGTNAERAAAQVRGHEATVHFGTDQTVAVWEEGPSEEPCAQYSVSAYGISREEFQKVLAGVS